jgi:small subunit ribosomal protein S1
MDQMEVGMDESKNSADNIQTQLQEEYLKSLRTT